VTDIVHVYKEAESIVHRLRPTSGSRDAFIAAATRGEARAEIAASHRAPTQRHHTATHLLHAALRRTLGTHVHQAGSLVAPDRLRFDYAHFEAPTPAQLAEIERIVSTWIDDGRGVSWRVMPIAEAKAQGAMALFGEKYGAEVRMVTVDGDPAAGIEPSRELCGRHARREHVRHRRLSRHVRVRDRVRRTAHRGPLRGGRGRVPARSHRVARRARRRRDPEARGAGRFARRPS
jgi:alanyl-tRNA synthetase